jgi:copper transport protein
MLAAGLVALGSISAQGHASVARLPALQIPVDALHATCAAFWVGGLVMLVIWLLRLPRVAGEGGRTVGGIVLARFSQLALIAVALIVLTGVVRAFGEMNSPADLWETSYGWTILVKIGLLAIASILAMRTRRVVTTRPVSALESAASWMSSTVRSAHTRRLAVPSWARNWARIRPAVLRARRNRPAGSAASAALTTSTIWISSRCRLEIT